MSEVRMIQTVLATDALEGHRSRQASAQMRIGLDGLLARPDMKIGQAIADKLAFRAAMAMQQGRERLAKLDAAPAMAAPAANEVELATAVRNFSRKPAPGRAYRM